MAHKLYVRGVYDDLYRIERKYDEHPDGTRTPVFDALLGPIFTNTNLDHPAPGTLTGPELFEGLATRLYTVREEDQTFIGPRAEVVGLYMAEREYEQGES